MLSMSGSVEGLILAKQPKQIPLFEGRWETEQCFNINQCQCQYHNANINIISYLTVG